MSRVKFKKGLQAKFLIDFRKLTGLIWADIAEKLEITQRTLLDWRNEKYTMTQDALKELIKISGGKIKIPEYRNLPDYWNLKSAAKKGGKVVAEKYGGPGTPEGRSLGGKNSQKKRRLFPKLYKNCILRKIIKIPERSSVLAEFIGIFLGDGGISNDFQITISFNARNGRSYCEKVKKIIAKLFGVKPITYKLSSPASRNVIRLVISSANLVDFLKKQNIKKGSKVKNQVDVPNWIKKDPKYAKSCLRGLVDTDGGVYYHHHRNNECKSLNVGLCFTNKSKPLLAFVEHTLSRLDFHPKKSSNGDNIFLYRESDVLRYAKEVGFNNTYQSKRLIEFLKIKKRKGARVV